MFLSGGIAGAYSFKYAGFLSVIPLAGYLLFMAIIPIRRDMTIQKYMRKRLRKILPSPGVIEGTQGNMPYK